jgi:hypothetical protein
MGFFHNVPFLTGKMMSTAVSIQVLSHRFFLFSVWERLKSENCPSVDPDEAGDIPKEVADKAV